LGRGDVPPFFLIGARRASEVAATGVTAAGAAGSAGTGSGAKLSAWSPAADGRAVDW
jgi:hypothetical protein